MTEGNGLTTNCTLTANETNAMLNGSHTGKNSSLDSDGEVSKTAFW